MADRSWTRLLETDQPNVWLLPITSEVSAGPKGIEPFLYGGMGLAAGIGAMERTTGRSLIWATAQYLSFATIGNTLELTVEVPAAGRAVANARAIGRVGEQEVISVAGSLGERPGMPEAQWLKAPQMPPPEECEKVDLWLGQHERARVNERIDVRMVPGEHRAHDLDHQPAPDGRICLWMRWLDTLSMRAGILAILADYVPSVIALATGRQVGMSSLDNSLRVVQVVDTDWVLCEVQSHGIHHGVGHGDMRMFARTGELMAVGSQSCLMRTFGRADGRPDGGAPG